jgi:SAM-dependent methyltransferase
MPEEKLWASFYQAELILDRLGLHDVAGDIVEFGCGYGTFTLAAARRTSGTLHALDIDREMVELVTARAKAGGIANIRTELRDFVAQGTGLPDESVAYAMLFNILHAAESPEMLAEARRGLRPGGVLGIIHWNYDANTPRGPAMEIRPRPEEVRDMAVRAGFSLLPPGIIDLPPYHYGMKLVRPDTTTLPEHI